MILEPNIETMDPQKLTDEIIKPRLRNLFQRAYQQFSYYKQLFHDNHLDPESEPFSLLESLPFMTKKDYSLLENEALRNSGKLLFYMEMTSGSTGKPKRRFQSQADDLNELKLATRVMAGFDLSRDDTIVFMDVGDPSIYLWFARACEALGVRDTIYYGIQSDFNQSIKGLSKLDPTVIFTVPSLLVRAYNAILEIYKEAKYKRLKKIIYFGEKLEDNIRIRVQEDLEVEIFSHYGGTEVSTLGGECLAHDGIHIYTDANFPSFLNQKAIDDVTFEGEIAWTTMLMDVQPVIKYCIGDVIRISYEKCRCGRTSPRAKIISRTGEGFSIYGVKFYYDTFLNTIYSDISSPGFLQIVLSSGKKRDRLTVILPEKLKNKEEEISQSLYYINELEFYLEERFFDLEIKFVQNSYFTGRKIPSIVDKRKSGVSSQKKDFNQ